MIKDTKGKATDKAEEVVESVKEALPDVDPMEMSTSESLDIEEDTPATLAMTLGKVAAVSPIVCI